MSWHGPDEALLKELAACPQCNAAWKKTGSVSATTHLLQHRDGAKASQCLAEEAKRLWSAGKTRNQIAAILRVKPSRLTFVLRARVERQLPNATVIALPAANETDAPGRSRP